MKLGTGAFDALLGRLLNIPQQQGGIAGELSPEISPVLVLEMDRPEWCYLKNERCCCGLASCAATVGQPALVTFRNPAGSGVLIVIDAVQVASNPANVPFAMTVFLGGQRAADLTTVSAFTMPRDSRYQGARPAGRISFNLAGAGTQGTGVEIVTSSQGGMLLNTPPIILTPGFSVDILETNTNLEIEVNFRWSERELRQYEQ